MSFSFFLDRTTYLPRVPTERNGTSNPASLTRLICGGLILPTIATIFGKFMFQRVHSNFQRTLLVRRQKFFFFYKIFEFSFQGGIAFIVLKGTAKIYYKQSQYIREAHREILNYESTATNTSHHHHYQQPPPPPVTPTTSTVDIHQLENSNEIYTIPTASNF